MSLPNANVNNGISMYRRVQPTSLQTVVSLSFFLSLPFPRACTRANVLHGPETWDVHTEKLGVSQLNIRTSSLPLPSSQEQVSRFDKQRTHDPL